MKTSAGKAIGNRQRAIGNWQQATGNRQQATKQLVNGPAFAFIFDENFCGQSNWQLAKQLAICRGQAN